MTVSVSGVTFWEGSHLEGCLVYRRIQTSYVLSTKILSVNPTTIEVESLIAPIFPKRD